jgi:hypothetical protein
MSTATLDINDANLSLWQDQQEVLHSPGYALLEGNSYSFGESARSQARLSPRQVNHRYWSQLDVEILTPAFGPSRHSADLVHAHLLEIHAAAGQPAQLMITAPGSLRLDQLALLLGIIEQCPFEAVGLVDRAVAAAANSEVGPYNWHVELQLHQALLTGISCEAGILLRDKVVPIPGCGWLAIQDSLAKAIADAFIQQTRFDPRRQAATEQALYDHLPTLLNKLQSESEYNMELGGHRARVERSLLATSCEKHYQRIVRGLEAQAGQVLLGPSLTRLPEILLHLPSATAVAESAISTTIAENLNAIQGDAEGLHFITSLPVSAQGSSGQESAPPPAATAPEPIPEPSVPTHCQIEFRDAALTLRHNSGPACRVNGEPVTDSKPLAANDLIELENGSAWRLVEVDANNGSQT